MRQAEAEAAPVANGRPMVPSTCVEGLPIAFLVIVVVGGLEVLVDGTLNLWSGTLLTLAVVAPVLLLWFLGRWVVRGVHARW